MPLITGWIDCLPRGEPIRPFSDLMIAPLSMAIVTDALAKIAEGRHGGMFQASGARDVSYAEVARHIARRKRDPGPPDHVGRGGAAAMSCVGTHHTERYPPEGTFRHNVPRSLGGHR